jgi:16S rRNA (guanine1207-N2)-methyltransferase
LAEHYFTRTPAAAHGRQEITFVTKHIELSMVTDTGVFSRHEVDLGTQLLVESVTPPSDGLVLDLGCGYGPIGLAYAAMQPNCHVHMTDVNERAVALAKENAARNNINNVTVHQGEGLAAVAGILFSLIVTNPPIRAGRTVLMQLFATALAQLEPQGRLAFVVRTQQGAKTLAREVGNLGSNVLEVAKKSGYRVYVATKSRGSE